MMMKIKLDGGALAILAALLVVPVAIGYEIIFRHGQPYLPAILLAVAVLCFCVHSVYDARK